MWSRPRPTRVVWRVVFGQDEAIQALPPKHRAVVILRMLDGYSTEETAAILNIPYGTVLSRLSRAHAKLKEHLQPYLQEKPTANDTAR